MTNRIALVLGSLIVGLILIDLIVFRAEFLLFLGKKLVALIEWMAFWR